MGVENRSPPEQLPIVLQVIGQEGSQVTKDRVTHANPTLSP